MKMSNRETCNGWTNWETWNFNLWYGDYLTESAKEYQEDRESKLEYEEVYNIVNGFVDQLLEDLTLESGFFSDAIGNAVRMLNLYELTEHILNSIND
jgi:hypothetical protein